MIRNEEAKRLAKEKEIWNKENRLSKEEEIKSWTPTIEVLEKIYKHFYSYKDFRLGKFNPSAVWLCQGNYNDEDKAAAPAPKAEPVDMPPAAGARAPARPGFGQRIAAWFRGRLP
jgi:hypothetical protein